MKLLALVNPGFEPIAIQEVKELISLKEVKVFPSVIEFEAENKEEVLKLFFRSQSFTRLLLSLGDYSSLEKINFSKLVFPWKDFFSPTTKFKIEILGVKGEENRQELMKNFLFRFFPYLESGLGFFPLVDLKKPDLLLLIFFNGENYFLGLDLAGRDLNTRSYRLFTSQSSLKGDLAYFFLRQAGLKKGERALFVWARDGTLAIEAALFLNKLPVQELRPELFSFSHFPLFQDFDFKVFFQKNFPLLSSLQKVFVFTESQPTFIATRKNAQLAQVAELLELSRGSLEYLEIKYSVEFDQIFFQITTKDEARLNEIYYQSGNSLKKGGKLIFMTRKDWDVPLSSKFSLLKKEESKRGESVQRIWVLEKNS